MGITSIGKAIFELRKARDITQEALASTVGVTPQAVSKWESGGTPDVELLPLIADYFGVSLDSLFGRSVADYSDLEREIATAVESTDGRRQKLEKAFEYCYAIQCGLMGGSGNAAPVSDIDIVSKDERTFSQILFDEGFSTMAFSKKLKYFLLMPEPAGGWREKFCQIDIFASLFALFADKNILAALFFLNERDNKPFTPKLIERALGVDESTAAAILERLLQFKFVKTSIIELDDELKTVYHFDPRPAFIGLLAMSDELLDRPNHFYGFHGGRSKPYLTSGESK